VARGFLGKVALGCLGVIFTASPAAAEWQFTPLIGLTFKGETTLSDLELAAGLHHTTFGGSVRWVGAGILGVEAVGVWIPGFFENDKRDVVGTGTTELVKESRVVSLMGNAVLTTPRRWTEYNLRPFVSGGFGFTRAKALDFRNLTAFDTSFNGLNIGGGAVGFFSQRTGVQFDVRYYRTIRALGGESLSIGDPRLQYMTASIGVVIRR
jgi:Outer membrane protein beta-barrel domain